MKSTIHIIKRHFTNSRLALRNQLTPKTGQPRFRKAPVWVELLENHKVHGLKGHIVPVFRGYARNFLLPLKIAYPIPLVNGKPAFPDGYSAKKQTAEFHEWLLQHNLPIPTKEQQDKVRAIQHVASEDDENSVDIEFSEKTQL